MLPIEEKVYDRRGNTVEAFDKDGNKVLNFRQSVMLPTNLNVPQNTKPIVSRVSIFMEKHGINNLVDQLKRRKVDNGKNVVGAEDLKQYLTSNDVGLTSQEINSLANEFIRNDSKGKPVIDLDQLQDKIEESLSQQLYDARGNPIEVFDDNGNELEP